MQRWRCANPNGYTFIQSEPCTRKNDLRVAWWKCAGAWCRRHRCFIYTYYSIYLFVFRCCCCSLFSPCVTRIFCTLLLASVIVAVSVVWYFTFATATVEYCCRGCYCCSWSPSCCQYFFRIIFFIFHFFMYSIFRTDALFVYVCVSSSLLSDGFLCTWCLRLWCMCVCVGLCVRHLHGRINALQCLGINCT